MAQHAPPTISAGLALIRQPVTHSAVGHTAMVTYAMDIDTPQTAQQIADSVQDEFANAWAGNLDTNATLEKPTVYLGDGTNVPAFAIGSHAVTVGTNNIVVPSPQVCILIKKTTALAQRKNRGRCYMPWIVAADHISEDGTVDPTYRGGLQTNADDWLADLIVAVGDMCIANKTLAVDPDTGKKYVTHIGEGEAITALTVEAKVATQRRRLVRG